jgi:hypothetical protein
MNKFVTSALALSVAGSLAHAGTSDGEWLELDREIASLATPVTSAVQGGINWSALIRVNEYYSTDEPFQSGGENLSGVAFQDIDLAASGQVGDFMWRISGDFDFDILVLEDAYASWQCGDMLSTRIGQYKPSMLRSANVSPENLLFSNRTALGSSFDYWDAGLGVTGSFEDMLVYSLSIMNGVNGAAADHAYYTRVEFNIGEGAGNAEGALGAGDAFAGTAGLSYANFDDTSGTGGDDAIIAADFAGTVGPFGFSFEIADIDKGLVGGTDEDFFASLGTGVTFDADSNPFDATVSFCINQEMEVALRFEKSDNDDDVNVTSVGFNWYQQGHQAKWQFAYSNISSDVDADEGSIFSAGLSLGSSGS